MTITEKKNDEYMIQVRLYRMLQSRLKITPDECNKIFRNYRLFEYISLCYEEYHMQGDEANYSDMMNYLKRQGYSDDTV